MLSDKINQDDASKNSDIQEANLLLRMFKLNSQCSLSISQLYAYSHESKATIDQLIKNLKDKEIIFFEENMITPNFNKIISALGYCPS